MKGTLLPVASHIQFERFLDAFPVVVTLLGISKCISILEDNSYVDCQLPVSVSTRADQRIQSEIRERGGCFPIILSLCAAGKTER